MKKKELRQRIYELEKEKSEILKNEKMWNDVVKRFIKELGEYGVKAEIHFPENPLIPVLDSKGITKYIPGMAIEPPPTLSFDFTEHDSMIAINGQKKENESEEEKKYIDFIKTENKYYVYINNFLATPMRYKILGVIYAYNTVPIASIRFENGILAEHNIDELVSCYTLENCIKQCEQLNEEMKEHRESWSEDCWRLEQLMQGVGHD